MSSAERLEEIRPDYGPYSDSVTIDMHTGKRIKDAVIPGFGSGGPDKLLRVLQEGRAPCAEPIPELEGGQYVHGELHTAAGAAEQGIVESENLEADAIHFAQKMVSAIQHHGQNSGYGENDDERLDLFEFTESRFPGHAAGEIIYKLMGWQKEHDPEYLIKVATWAFLMWKFHFPNRR